MTRQFIFALVVILQGILGRKANPDLVCKKSSGRVTNRNLCVFPDYNKFDLPVQEGVNMIDIGIDITDVLRINDKEYGVEFSSYFNVMWRGPRLHIPHTFLGEWNSSLSEEASDALIPVNLELVKQLWLPNIFIYNLKTFKVVEVLSKHAGLWITRDKEIMYSQATHINFICPMRFDNFPLDTQICKFQVGSYSYEMSKMTFTQSNKVQGFVKTKNSVVLDYHVSVIPLENPDRILSYGELGNFSVAGFEMVLERHLSHYIITYYLPSGLFVVVSWISFMVPPDIIPGRMALLVTLFLVLVNIFNNITTNTPKAEGLTAIEIWMLSCILFVFGALIEYAIILFRRQTKCTKVRKNPNNDFQMFQIEQRLSSRYEDGSDNGVLTVSQELLPLESDRKPSLDGLRPEMSANYVHVDRAFLIAMPVLFLVFNITYWATFGSHFFSWWQLPQLIQT